MSLFRLFSLWIVFVIFTSLLHAQGEYKYSYMPKKVYENQLFPVTIIGINEEASQIPQFTFDSSRNIQPLYNNPLIVHNGNDSFYTFYFKAETDDVIIPELLIQLDTKEEKLPKKTIAIKKLKKRKDFCHVLAADMKIKNSQVSNYDEKNNIVTLTIKAYEANIEDMHLDNVQESDIDSLKRHFAKVEAEFYVILPVETKILKFTYFNTIKKQYVFIEIPVEVEDASVVTQTDLNPKEDSFEKLKKYSLITLSGFFLLMFLLKRDFFYLVFAVVSFITLLTLFIPHKKICVKQGAPLYIIPTATSTVSTKIDEKLDTFLLNERGDYKKVEYKDGLIGWIKNEDICNN